MRYSKQLGWLGLALLVGLAAWAFRTGTGHSLFPSPSAPVFEYPRLIELGDQERGRLIEVPISFSNRGNAVLSLKDGGRSCACLALIESPKGKPVRFDSVELGPGESKQVWAQMVIRGTTGKTQRELVRIHSNDPGASEVTIEIVTRRVRGPVVALPESVAFGSLRIGESRRQVVEFHDDHSPPRQIKAIRSTNPELFTVRILSPGDSPESSRKPEEGYVRIARCEVTLQALAAGDITGGIEVELADDKRTVEVIPVLGRIAPPVELVPSVVVLPRSSGTGDIHHALITCHVSDGHLTAIDLLDVPAELAVDLGDLSDHSTSTKLRVEWKPETNRPQAQATVVPRLIRLRVRSTKGEFPLDLPVYCRAKEAG